MAEPLYPALLTLLIAHAQAPATAEAELDTDGILAQLARQGIPPDRVLVNLYLVQLARQGYLQTRQPVAGTLVVWDPLVPGLQRLL